MEPALGKLAAGFEGDAFFPRYEHLIGTEFERINIETYPPENGRPAYRFETFARITR